MRMARAHDHSEQSIFLASFLLSSRTGSVTHDSSDSSHCTFSYRTVVHANLITNSLSSVVFAHFTLVRSLPANYQTRSRTYLAVPCA